MANSKPLINYINRIEKVLEYIYKHLDQELDMLKLAEVACLSPYHWHRIYHAIQGESVFATVKRLRLHKAAGYLANSDMSIEQIMHKAGYNNLQSFNRIFKAEYGLPPGKYRKLGSHTQFKKQQHTKEYLMHEVMITEVPQMKVVAIEHHGDYMNIGKSFDQLFSWLAANNLITAEVRSFGIYYDDPESVAADKLFSRACALLPNHIEVKDPMHYTTIQAGNYAKLAFQGPYADMHAAYQWFYGEWLPKSDYEMADAPPFEEYVNDPKTTPPAELRTDIYLPLK